MFSFQLQGQAQNAAKVLKALEVVTVVVKVKSMVVRQWLVDEWSCDDGCRDDRLYYGHAVVHLVEVRVGGSDGFVHHHRVGIVVVVQRYEPGRHNGQDGGENSLRKGKEHE